MKIKQFFQKIICMVVVFTMLVGNFISPVISIANELNESEKANIAETNVEVNNNNEGGEEPTTTDESNSVDETQAKIDEIDAAFEANQEKEQDINQDEDNNKKSSEEVGESQEQIEQEDETHAEKDDKIEPSEEDNQIEEPNKDQTQPNNVKGARKSAPALRGANNQSSETQSDKIEDRVTPDKIDEIEEKSKNDAYEINNFQTEFVSGATNDENGNLVWTADTNASGHEFRFRINYALSGLKEHPAEAIKITIPKQILRNRTGNLSDKYEMSLPTDKEYDGSTEFAYIENEEYIVIYNPAPVKAAVNGYVEVAYKTNQSTTNYRDYDKTKTDLITNGGTASDPFNAVITVKTTVNNHEDILAKKSDDKNIFIDTTAKIQSTQKYQPIIYREWNNSWMEEVPEDKDDYYYLIWQVATRIQSGTQPYTFSLQDTITNLTEGTSADDYQFVGYKLSGERYYSDKNTVTIPAIGTSRTDYVLTRHKKSTFANISYKLKNTVTATIYPIDEVDPSTNATSSNTFSWKYEFTIPTGHFNLFKYGNSNWNNGYWDYANYDLDKLQNGEVDELKEFKYSTNMVGYAYPWTLKEGGSSNNPEDYGYNPVNYDTWDDTLYLENDVNPMNYEDYYLEYFTYSINNSDAEYDDFYNRFNTKPAAYANDEVITFYGKFADNQNWTEIGTVNLNTKELTFDDTYIEEITTSKVAFKPGVHATGWRYTTTNKHYYTDISVVPYFVLTNSDYVMEKIANKDRVGIKNIVKTHITNYKNEAIFDAERSAIDYARVTYYDSHIAKTVTAASNNVTKRKYTISWSVNAYETATNGSGVIEYIRQDSGKFYDLIPAGGELDLKSISVRTESGYLSSNEYTYEIISNYKDSGRTMLIINIDLQAKYYTVYYKTVYSWESMQDYGKNVLNPVAYETGNEKITKGSPDDGGDLSDEHKALFTNLDNTTDANKFLYDEKPHSMDALTATISGLYKMVKSGTDTDYQYDTKVDSNGEYQYRLRYQNTFLNKTKDLILYDSLENFKIVDSEAGTVKTSGWKGTLQSIDVSQLRSKGINPVVYISTQEDLNPEEHKDLTDTSIWKKATVTTNLFEAKAIAIDLRKDTDGNDFVLGLGESVSVTLNMKAPDFGENAGQWPYAYNNIYLSGTLLDGLEEITDFFIHQDYTSVKYYVTADVPMVKVNEDDENETIKGITFRLWGTSVYGTEVDELLTSDRRGRIIFRNIEVGEYKLQEYETNDDWFMDYTEHSVEIKQNRDVYIDGELVNELMPCKITNKRRIYADVLFLKKDLVTKSGIKGAKFKLSGTSEYGNEVLLYGISNEKGEIKFEGLEYGSYEMIEVAPAEGYVANNDKWKVIVDENGNYDIQRQILEKVTRSETTQTTVIEDVVKYAHTPNINDQGYASTSYSKNLYLTTPITIPGAEQLEVTVYYSTEAVDRDWVAVYLPNITPTSSNYGSSISGRRGGGGVSPQNVNNNGYEAACRKYSTVVQGDSVQFFFISNSAYNKYYGYYAIITARDVPVVKDVTTTWEETVARYESIYSNGGYTIYNEPLHKFRFQKKDEYSGDNIAGAKFRLYGISNYGNRVEKNATSSSIGFVEFNELEAGTYILQETYVPETTDEQGNPVSYILDNTKYIVIVEKDKEVVIQGVYRNLNGEYIIYNKRNKGQIIITKKWNDQKNNDQRPEPIIHISNDKPEPPVREAYIRDNIYREEPVGWGQTNWVYRSALAAISSNTSFDSQTGVFSRNTQLEEEDVVSLGAVRIDREYNNPYAKYKIYAWFDNEGNIFWWSNADVIKLTDGSNRFFYELKNIQSIDATGIDTSEMTRMHYMFAYCGKLTSVNLSSFDTRNVTDMSSMFYKCYLLNQLNLSSFDTRNVTGMSAMFYECRSLESINLSSFDTSNVTTFANMFKSCGNLTQLDVSNFNTSSAKNMTGMFASCSKLAEIDVSGFDTSNVNNMSRMFEFCTSVEELDIGNFITSGVTDMSYMFYICSSVTSLDVSKWDTGNVTNMSYMFDACRSVTSLDVSKWDTGNVRDMSYMFNGCRSVTSLDLSKWNTGGVTTMYYMFQGCSSLTSLDVSKWDTGNVENMSYMFNKCGSLTSLDLSKWNTGSVTTMSYMFHSCSSLTSLDISKWDIGSVTIMSYMFYNCNSLTSLDVSEWDTGSVTNMFYMIYGCNSLTSIDVSEWNTGNVKYMSHMFDGCSSLTSLDVSKWNTDNVTDMAYMFNDCGSLTSLDLSKWNTGNVTGMSYMFNNCENIITIYAGSLFTTDKVTNSLSMFNNCISIIGGNGTIYDPTHITQNYACIDKVDQPGYFTEKVTTSGVLNNNTIVTTEIYTAMKNTNDISSGKSQVYNTYLNKKNKLLAPNTIDDEEENHSSETITYSTAETNYDDEGNEVHWVKNGDIWTYTFYVDDPYATWYVWEDEMEGYETNYNVWNPGLIQNQTVEILNYIPQNKREIALEFGSLSITKTLIQREENDEIILTSDDDNTKFIFTIKLSAAQGEEEKISGMKVFGDYVFRDGICNVSVMAGETIIIEEIPKRLTYEVTEMEIDGYETFAGATGIIVKNETREVHAINYKEKADDSTIPEPEEHFTSFRLAKTVTGNAELDELYNFEISLINLNPETIYTLSNGQTFTSDSIGSANVSVSLKNNESVTVQNIPVGAKYKVYEHAGDYISSYVITDANNAGLINNTAKANTKENKDLSTNTETADEGEDVTITFTNRIAATQNLKIRKTVTDTEDANSYMFDIEFANLEEGTSIDSTVGKLDEEDGKIEITIYLAGGEEAEFYNIPVGTTYTIKELASDSIASYTVVDANGGNNIVSASKANTAAKKALSTERETVNQGEEATVTFINDTVNQEPDSVTTSLGVTKKVVDADGENVNNCNETFTFELKAEDDANPMPEKTSVTITGNGEASFGTITFDSVGIYTYTVVEKAGNNEECTYDSTVYTIVYEVTNAEGLLEVTKTVKKNGFIGDVVEFTNIMPKEDEPDTPDTPDTPDKPDEPETPDEPGKPDEPTNPEEPEQPEEPENKGEDKPAPTPDKPNSPQTGDNIIIAVVTGMLAIMVFVVTKKKSNKGKHF